MARPIKADAQATRARLIAAASALFAERGVDGASVRQIAAGAGVSLAMVHHYFGSKGGLYRACIDVLYRQIEARIDELERALATTDAGDVRALLDRAIRGGFAFARANQGAVRLLMQQVTGRGELEPRRRDGVQAPFLDSISEQLAGPLGRDPHQLRLPIQSATSLVVRYALSTDDELALFTGGADDPVAAVQEHLSRTVAALFA